LTAFDPAKPCRHWLLKPDGFGKEHFELLAQKYSLGILEGYLRWVGNEEAFAKNINDLADEGSGKLVELTIKHKTLQWSFSCGASDLSGHDGGGDHSKRPHWHFQMYVDGKPFIRYNDFHLPLSDEDVGFLEFMRNNPGKVKKRLAGGTGMSELLDESTLEHIVTMGRSGTSDDDLAAAPIELNTLVFAEPGKTIKGEDIYNLIQAAKAENVTVTSKLRDLKDVSIQTMVSPGPGVVAQAVRSSRKRKRGNKLLREQDREWRERQKREGNPHD
jgi:ribosomal protein L12E/L44/L45/RPP1/RPP2